MKHRYAHIKTLDQLNDEILRIKLKKGIIRNELSLSVESAKESLMKGKFVWNALLRLVGIGKFTNRPADAMDRASDYAVLISNLLNMINSLRR